jgi:hypothetical protein
MEEDGAVTSITYFLKPGTEASIEYEPLASVA